VINYGQISGFFAISIAAGTITNGYTTGIGGTITTNSIGIEAVGWHGQQLRHGPRANRLVRYILEAGGRVINGSLTDSRALIYAGVGVDVTSGMVSNFGSIECAGSEDGYGVDLVDAAGRLDQRRVAGPRRARPGLGNRRRRARPRGTVANFGTFRSQIWRRRPTGRRQAG